MHVFLLSPSHLHRQNVFFLLFIFLILSFSLLHTSHNFTSNIILVFSAPLLPLFLFLRTSSTFTFFLFFQPHCFLFFIVNCLFFHFTVPPDLPSLPISLALGLLNCAFYLHTALQYSGGGGLFSSYAQFRDHTVPSTISIHLPPTFSSSHDCF